MLVVAAVLLVGAAAWFVAVQAFVLREACPYCLAAHACGVAAAALVFARLPAVLRPAGGATTDGTAAPILRPRAVAVGFAAGLAGVALLAIGQVLGPRLDAMVFRHDPGAHPPGSLVFHGGDVVLTPGEFPSVGPAGAAHHFALFFDYTCPHCRRLHVTLDRRPPGTRVSSTWSSSPCRSPRGATRTGGRPTPCTKTPARWRGWPWRCARSTRKRSRR